MKVLVNGQPRNAEDPNICPLCHITNAPHMQWNAPTEDIDGNPIYISVWQCANFKCKKLFVVLHRLEDSKFIFSRFLNGYPKGPDWPKPIINLEDGQTSTDVKNLSKFIKTYLQSLEAENYGLDELAGMGYRKAIEYLVKDWAIQNNPSEKDKIKKFWLGDVIKNYFDGDLKDILERATWLGNDQAHYNKLFEEYDVSILKELIDLILVELDRQYKKALYISTIQSRK